MRAFWSKGYDRTSIADLCVAVGLGPSSIYNAFGSKAELFRAAIQHYAQTYVAPALELVAQPRDLDPIDLVRKLMRNLIKVYTAAGDPRGCAIFQGGSGAAPTDSVAAAITQQLKDALRENLRQRFVEYDLAGKPLASPPQTLAIVILSALSGVSQLACDGVSRPELFKAADHVARSILRQDD